MNELALWNKEEEPTMTVKEVAEVLGVTERLIQKKIKELPNDRSPLKNSQGGYLLNQYQVTAIKLNLEKNPHLDNVADLPRTDLEKRLIVQQAMGILNDEISTLQKELEKQKPAVDFYKAVTSSKGAIEMGQVAKVLDIGLGRNKVFEQLRELGILRHNNEPYQSFIDRGYFRVIEQKFTKPDGEVNISIKTLVYQKGLDFIRKQLSK